MRDGGVSCRVDARPGPMSDVTTRKTREPARAQGMRRAGRRARGYPSDLADAQQVIAPHHPRTGGRRGRPGSGLLADHRATRPDRTGCAWRPPPDFPPGRPSSRYFAAWRDDGTSPGCTRFRPGQTAPGHRPARRRHRTPVRRAADTVPKASGLGQRQEVNGRKAHRRRYQRADPGRGGHRRVRPDRQGARPLLRNTHRACRQGAPGLG